MSVSENEFLQHEESGPWRELLARAQQYVDRADKAAGFAMQPLLGGGTRLMLSLHHRLSDDIDLFIRDPQWIGYLTPRLNEEIVSDGYEENAVSLKLRYDIGEIDFIVAMSLLREPPQRIDGVPFNVESIAEVLAKKLFYRGALLTPRDLFDWWAIATLTPAAIPHTQMATLLKDRLEGIEAALNAMNASPTALKLWNGLRTRHVVALPQAVEFGLKQIHAYRS